MRICETLSQLFHRAQVEFLYAGRSFVAALRNERTRIDVSEVQFEDCASCFKRQALATGQLPSPFPQNVGSDRETSRSPIAGPNPARAQNVRFFLPVIEQCSPESLIQRWRVRRCGTSCESYSLKFEGGPSGVRDRLAAHALRHPECSKSPYSNYATLFENGRLSTPHNAPVLNRNPGPR
jgi:hypothetical protein